ncbi:MAG: hypothetical protein KGI70_02980 [Patescibacteria group bacterium]|nr:hypothetical protein [Patescibacteria group bacterium]
MGCEILVDRVGTPACGIKGSKSEHATTARAVSITEACDVDVGNKVVLTYARGGTDNRLTVKVGIESENGEKFRCWVVRNVRSAHNPAEGKKRSYARLRGFLEMARDVGIKPVVLANYILEKAP